MKFIDFTIPNLGTLRMLEVFEYYDQPLLFSCENKSGQIFIALSIDELNNGFRWFYLPVSRSRYDSIRQGIISLKNAFLQAEEGWVWDVHENTETSSYFVSQLLTSKLTEDDLPADNESLKLPSRSLPELLVPAIVQAERSKRDVLDLSISSDNNHSTEIDAECLGLILIGTQGLIHALGHKHSTTKGRIPKEKEEETTFRATYAFAASFGIRLESKSNELFEDTKSSEAIENMMSLLKAKNGTDKMIDILKDAGIRTSSRYRSFLKTIKVYNLTLTAEWGSPLRKSDKWKLSSSEANYILSILEAEGEVFKKTHKLKGTLVGVQTEKNSFWFNSEEGKSFKGLVDDALRNRTFKVPAKVSVEIEESLKINDITQQEQIEYLMKNIEVYS